MDQQLRNALQLAHAYQRSGNPTQAAAVCHQIIQVLPNQPDAWHLLGVIALQQGNIELAIPQLLKALKGQPNNPEYNGNLAYAYHEKGALEEAQRYYRKALALDPDYGNALFNQHALLLDGKDMGQAIENLQRALRVNPVDADACYMLGVLLDYSGDELGARALLDRFAIGTDLDRARLDAWQYLKSACPALPPITGSMMQTFRLALAAAPHQGLVLEFGVRFGNTIRQIAGLVADQPVHGFDSFEGLPEVWHHEPKGSYTTKGEIPKVPSNVTLHVGWFEDTLPKFLAQHAGPVRFVNVDCDIYSSTKTVLDQLAPRMVVGSVLVFDEYIGNAHWRDDEFKAFQEAIVRYGWSYETLCFSVYTKQVAVRLTAV
jgi:tetratricopeptide (TPR) repeat protein